EGRQTLVCQTRSEEPNHVPPRAVRDFRVFTGPQEAMADAGIHGVAVALVVRADRRVHVGQAGVDARVILRVDAEPLGTEAGHGRGVGAGPGADDEGSEGWVVGRIAEALP